MRALASLAPWDSLGNILMELATFLPTMFSGYLFARYGWFDSFGEVKGNKWIKILLLAALAVAAAMGRWAVPSLHLTVDELPLLHIKPIVYLNLDVIYAPVFVFCVVSLNRWLHTAFTDRLLAQIGKNSLLMWFASCIFFNNSRELFRPLLYLPRNSVLVLLWGGLLCYIFARVLDYPVQKLLAIKNSRILLKKKAINKTS